jgi:dTDP-4-amino-4,6-dideoxygalactose transaminase
MQRIDVTKTFLPPLQEYQKYLNKIWANAWVTNQGPLLREFETRFAQHQAVENFHFVGNGTLALQVALRALDVTEGEIITTPFSYVATTSAILWERCTPVYVDIHPDNFCIDERKIEAAITDKTKAIMPVHVFGNPCNIEAIKKIAQKHDIKVIYDAAHAFGVQYKGRSLLDQGDISICSFHATKLFHTIEGGGLVVRDKAVSDKVELIKRFGHEGDTHLMLGINAKVSEMHAAMGLCNLVYIDAIIKGRKKVSKLYDALLGPLRSPVGKNFDATYNYAYYPILLRNEAHTLEVITRLQEKNIYPRRYFYPSLNKLPYIQDANSCPISEDITNRILCLPLYADLDEQIVRTICEVLTA